MASLHVEGRPYVLVEAAPAVATIVSVTVAASSAVAEMATAKARSEVMTTVAATTVSIAVTAAPIPTAAVPVLDGLHRRRSLRDRHDTKRCRGDWRGCQEQTGSHQASTERECLEHQVSPCDPGQPDGSLVIRTSFSLNGVRVEPLAAVSQPANALRASPPSRQLQSRGA